MRDLNGKVAVITGGASGIGLAMARHFGREGMKLVIADIEPDALATAADDLRAHGFEAIGVRTDVSTFDEVEALARATLGAFGRVHIVVNNAGVSITGPTWDMSLDDWRWVYGVNVWGVVHGIKAFVPILIAQGEPAHIVNTASLAAIDAIGEHAPYSSSKAACVAISRSLHSELIAANTQIGVSVVCPGMVATAIHRSWRNRPAADRPWSDREWNDAEHRASSEEFQGAGVEPDEIAHATIDAIRENRFYVFDQQGDQTFRERRLGPLLRAENPPVVTWGPDLRPVFTSLPDRIAAQARQRPSDRALIQDDQSISFAALESAMNRVAASLQAAGLVPQDVIAICAANSIAYVELFCAALRAGIIVAPLPPTATADSLASMIADCGAAILFLDAAAAAHLAPVRTRIEATTITLDDTGSVPLRDWLAPPGTLPEPVEVDPQWAFNIIYSSGTTGTPKGIVQSHAMRSPYDTPDAPFGYGPDTVTLISTGLYSNTTLTSVFPALGGGGAVLLMAKFDAVRFLELAQQWHATHAMLVPVQFQRIMAVPDFDRFDLSTFKMKFCTSAPFSAALKADVLRRWPGGLTEYYGMTEQGGGTVLYAHERPDKLHTVGRPWPWTDIRLIGEDGREVAPGAVGEVVGASGLAMTGYHNRPDATAAATWHDAEGRPFIRHGDMGRFDEDGFLILMDRKKDMIISGGFNVYPSDLEAALCEHPGVAEAAVIGVPSEAWGETPAGFVTLHPAATETGDEIRAWVNARLGKVQRISSVDIMNSLPRNHIGKVMKRELRDMVSENPGLRPGPGSLCASAKGPDAGPGKPRPAQI